MRVMTHPSPPNDTEACSSEGSSFSSISTPSSTSTSPSDPPTMSMHAFDALQGSSNHQSDSAHQHLPPPPPPLPPPPPPLPPSTAPPANHGVRKKRRVRSFYWKPIPEEKVRGRPNIWTMSVRQQQYQIDVRSVEELFGQPQEEGGGAMTPGGAGRGETPPSAAGRPALIARSRSFRESSKDEISILDSKRGMNVGIFLKQFKKSNVSIVEDIRLGDGKIYGAELLKDLLKLLPDVEEVKKLQSFKGDPSKLTLVDNFMYQLIQIPRFEVRIEAMVLREEFFPSCAVMSRDIDVIHVATNELMNCEELHAILHLVLQAGNIMNAGGYAGNAVGFKLSSLLSLADTKANKPGMNLLHFVALEAKKKDEKLLKFPEKLQHVQCAARISVENIEMEFSSLYVRTRSLEEKVQGDQDLLLQLEPFLQSSVRTLQELQRRRLDLRKEGNALIDFFCEDKDSFKLDEGFRIFQDFCLKFKKAVKDNLERELKEVTRQRRLRELEEKRLAWSAAEVQQSGGGFGRSSSESDMDLLTREGLLDLFQQRSQSPHSPLGRSASARRHRHTVSSTAAAERELQGYLELFGGGPSDLSKFNSLPRSGRSQQRRTCTPWLSSQDDNRELTAACRDRPSLLAAAATSPRAETEPISPLVRYSTSGFSATDEDPFNNNTMSYSSVSEGSVLPRNSYVFQKTTQAAVVGHMNVSVEKHLLVRVPQAFDHVCGPNNNNNRHTLFVHQGDVVLTDLEMETPPPPAKSPVLLDNLPCRKSVSGRAAGPKEGNAAPPPPSLHRGKDEDEDNNSTVSSTTCDTTLPLDPSLSNKKPALYLLDCTETDCSVAFDCSDMDSSPLTREGLTSDLRTLDYIIRDSQENQQDPSSLSSNLESMSTNDQTVSTSTNELSAPLRSPDAASVTPCATAAEEWDTDSCDTAEGRQVGEKAVQTDFRIKAASKASKASGIRTLTTSENQGMRKVVPITKTTRAVGGHAKRAERGACQDDGETPHRPLRDQSTPARGRSEKTCRTPRHSSLPPDETKVRSGSLTCGISRWARDSTPKKSSFRKPSAKPLRNIPKLAPEEKMCRSTMRALAQSQNLNLNLNLNLNQSSSEVSGSQTLVPKVTAEVPSFARNTVASSSRTKKELGPPSVPSTPSRSPSLLARTASVKQNKVSPAAPHGEDRPHTGSLRKVQSAKPPRQSSYCSDTPPPPAPPPPPSTREDVRKSNSFTEKSVQTKDSVASSKSPKPSWK